jgi:prevent-host-death family protein
MKNRTVTLTEFKANCGILLDELATYGNTITITKRGRAFAKITPTPKKWKPFLGALAGKGRIIGDIINTSDLWNAAGKK